LQEGLEHELRHLKYHLEGSKDDKNGEPDEKFNIERPKRIRHETGYMAQERIREDDCGESSSSRDCDSSKILDCGDNSHFQPPLITVFEFLQGDQFADMPETEVVAKDTF